MKTKDKIKEQARILFNTQGVMNVTLRQVANAIERSYGNVTYHYKNKQLLIWDLYLAMHNELLALQPLFTSVNLLNEVLDAPKSTFSISLKYAFFFTDFMELKRNFNSVANQLQQDNQTRKSFYLQVLKQLQTQHYLRDDLGEEALYYLMDLSGMVRTYFFISLSAQDLKDVNLEKKYVMMVNQLLLPYLTETGIKQYNLWLQKKA